MEMIDKIITISPSTQSKKTMIHLVMSKKTESNLVLSELVWKMSSRAELPGMCADSSIIMNIVGWTADKPPSIFSNNCHNSIHRGKCPSEINAIQQFWLADVHDRDPAMVSDSESRDSEFRHYNSWPNLLHNKKHNVYT